MIARARGYNDLPECVSRERATCYAIGNRSYCAPSRVACTELYDRAVADHADEVVTPCAEL
jgi:hypothetical protein